MSPYIEQAMARRALPISVDCVVSADDDFCICISWEADRGGLQSCFAVTLEQAHEHYAEAVAELGGR